MSAKAKSLPVVTYHLVNTIKGTLTVSPATFENHCRILAEQGWRGVGLDEAEAFWLGELSLPAKSLLISLDDGYLDNYVYAWPILQKYGHKAVIFAVTTPVNRAQEQMEAVGSGPRYTLQDVWDGKIEECELPLVNDYIHTDSRGHKRRRDLFFSWDEARRMEQSGSIAIAGHSLNHAGIFTGPEYSDFSRPQGGTIPFPHLVDDDFWGRPRFTTGSELQDRQFHPSEALLNALRETVPQEEDAAFAFFSDAGNIRKLEELVHSFASNPGRMETDEEQKHRLFSAMQTNQDILKKELGHTVTSFSWPWGHCCAVALDAGRAAGFKVFYTVQKGANPPGSASAVHRMNYKDNPKKMLGRLRIYSSPLLSALYKMIRI